MGIKLPEFDIENETGAPAPVSDRSSISARSDIIEIDNTAKIVNTLGNGLSNENLSVRQQVEIQPLDGVCFVGYSPTSQPHRIPRRQFYIAKIGPDVDLYIRKNGAGTEEVAVSELS